MAIKMVGPASGMVKVRKRVSLPNPNVVTEFAESRIEDILRQVATEVEKKARELVSKGGGIRGKEKQQAILERGGRQYGKGRGTRFSSPPGDPPFKRTGTLQGAIRMSRISARSYVIGVGRKAYYARYLEFGTAKMAARPFLRRASEAGIVKFLELLSGGLS